MPSIAVWDPHKEVTVRNEALHHNVVYTPYEEMQLTDWPEVTLSRGVVAWFDVRCDATVGCGQFLPCGLPDPARPKRVIPD